MKMTFFGPGGEQIGAPELVWRWGAPLFGNRRAADRPVARRILEFALDANSVCRIAGNIRGARIDCRQGFLWLTQAGANADVILQPGQNFVAAGDGAIVVQPVLAVAAADGGALGRITLMAGAAARLNIHPGPKPGTAGRIGLETSGRDQTGWWEQLAFIALWLCSVFSVGYCLRAVLSLSWPR
jgi:hypothetical protein